MSDTPAPRPAEPAPPARPTGSAPGQSTGDSTSTAGGPPTAPQPGRVPPPPGPVFVPAGLGLPVGYYTPATHAGIRRQAGSFAHRRFSLVVVGGGLALGLLVGGGLGAGAVALAGGDSHDHSQVGSGGVQDTIRGEESFGDGER